LIRSSS